MNLAQARSLFPNLADKTFLDWACIGLAPRPAVEAVQAFLEQVVTCPARDASEQHIALDRSRQLAVREAANLIGAKPHEIALVESTTHGLNVAAAGIPIERGQKVLVPETEYLGVAVPWIPLVKERGIEIVTVPAPGGRVTVEQFARAADARTRLILISSVQWTHGYRPDLAALGELARERSAWLVVDAIQQLGAVRLDVRETPIDILVTGGHKWLCAPFGRGFMYVREERLGDLRPLTTGYLTIATPPGGWGKYFATPDIPAVRDYEFAKSAKRLEIGGTSNYPGNAGLAACLKLFNEIGVATIERHVLALGDRLIEGLRRIGARVVSPTEAATQGAGQPACRSGIVTFTLGGGPERDAALLEHLLDRKIYVSIRYTAGVGGIRTSLHFANDEQDVSRLLQEVKAFA